MNQQARPAANAFPSRAGATPARPSVPARAVPAACPAARPRRPSGRSGCARPASAARTAPAARPAARPRPDPAASAGRPRTGPAARPASPPRQCSVRRSPRRPASPPAPAAPQQPPDARAPVPRPRPRAVPPAPASPAAAPEQVGPPPRPRKSKIGRWVALLVIAGGVGGAVWYGTHAAPTTEGVGDCLAQTGGNQLTKVSCGDKSSRFRVLGKLENKTVVDATLDACSAFPTATSAYWEGESGQRGLVLCLEPVTPAAAARSRRCQKPVPCSGSRSVSERRVHPPQHVGRALGPPGPGVGASPGRRRRAAGRASPPAGRGPRARPSGRRSRPSGPPCRRTRPPRSQEVVADVEHDVDLGRVRPRREGGGHVEHPGPHAVVKARWSGPAADR